MSGAGQTDVLADHTEDPPLINKGWISSFDFADAAAYNTISYSYTNTDTDGSRARFMGVIVDVFDPSDPSVDAGDNWITWSGQPVQLDPNYAEGYEPNSFAWSANPGAGVVFDPNAYVEDPTVTITKDTDNPSTVKLTLTADDGTGPMSDTLEIDVYDDACQAAIGKGLDPIGPADFDANCVTDLRDYAVLAAKWLVDYALTAPIPKP